MIDASANEHAKSGVVTLLLVEDDDGDALLLRTMLERTKDSFTIRRARCLAEALREVEEGGVDVVLLDLGLPDSWGLETCTRLCAAGPRTPVIVLSGLEDEALAARSIQSGAQDYVVKGQVDPALLSRTIRHAIERCRARHDTAAVPDLLRGLLDNIPDQVYVKDADSRFVAVNAPTARFFGKTPEQLVGKTDFDFFPRELAAQFRAEEEALLKNNQPCINREAAITDATGVTRWILTTKVPLRDREGGITGLLGINRDINERKAAEEAIRRVNAELEQRVNDRTRELREAMARLEEHDRARAEFVSSVSHELKTPLTSMKFELANLLGGVVGPVSERVIEYLHLLETDCQRMAKTVEDILDLSRLESRTMRLHRARLALGRVVAQAAAALKSQAATKGIEMVLAVGRGGGFVDCDAHKISRALINIIGNAIKFTPRGGRVEISLHADGSPEGCLVVDVTDNGIGIAPQHLPRVAEKYFRVGEYVSGTGLGLSISKEIIEMHGGRLVFQSPPPARAQGTRVSVILPAAAPPAILVANLEPAVSDALLRQLGDLGYGVTVCHERDGVLDAVRRCSPDVVILDVATSGTADGDLVLRLKAEPDVRDEPIVGVAAGPVSAPRQSVLEGLGVSILQAPWIEEELLDRIETAMAGTAVAGGDSSMTRGPRPVSLTALSGNTPGA